MSMFGSLSHKIAHASTIPSLGNQDLRTLQDLITREKEVVASIQRLSGELFRANEALKAWGQGEGIDLGDTLTQSTVALNHIISALNGFAGHEQNIRAHMKEIRTREENLDDLRRRRKNVMTKAEAAEKKLNRMGSENKYLVQQTNLLAQLTDEMRQLDTEILSEEARIGDFKRRVTKQFMVLKFGGLLEFAEKATIVGELGKLIINEIPLETTAPGQPRVPYHGYERTVQLTSEITRCINEVRFVADPDQTALAALKGNSKDDASEPSELVPPPPLSTIIEPEFGGQTQEAKLPSPSSPKKATFEGVLSPLGRNSSSERGREMPLNLPIGSREPYQAHSQHVSFTEPPNLFLPEIGGPSLSASLGISSLQNEGQQNIEGLPVSPNSNTGANNNSKMDRTFMNIPSEFGGRPPLVTENRTVSSSAPLAPLTPVSRPQYNTLPLSRPSEEKPVVPSVPPPAGPAPPAPLIAKPPAPLVPVQQNASQGSMARILDPPGTKVAAGRFAAFPLKSRRATNALPPENNMTTDVSPQSRPAGVVPTAADAPDNRPARAGDAPSKIESPRPSTDEEDSRPILGNTKPHIRRKDSARVRFAATPPITPATGAFNEGSNGDDIDVPQVDDSATEETIDEEGWRRENKGLSDANNPDDGPSVAPLRKKPSFEPPEPVKDVDDMSEAELNAMIDAMAAQVGQGLSPSSTISPTSQFSPASGSPPSTLPTPTVSRIGSATYPNRTLASGSPAGGDPPLTLSGRISAVAFKRPVSKMQGLPSNPRAGGGDTTSRLNMAPGAHPRFLPPPEPRGSTEEVGQASSQRAMTPPVQGIRAQQTPSPPPVTALVQPAEHPQREKSPTPLIPTLHEDKSNTLERSPLPPAATSTHYSHATLPSQPPPPSVPLPLPPAPPTLDMDFETISTPEFEKGELPLASSQAADSPIIHEPSVPSERNESVGTQLPPGAGPPHRPGDVVLPGSHLPGARQDSPVRPQSPERGHSRRGSASFNDIPPSLRPGTPGSAPPVQQDFTGVGSLARTNKDGSRRLGDSPPRVGLPSLMPLDPYSPILDFGDFGSSRGSGTAGLPQRAPSSAGYGEGKFMTNLEDEYKQEKKADPKRGSGSWR